jgi:hypothetical protein
MDRANSRTSYSNTQKPVNCPSRMVGKFKAANSHKYHPPKMQSSPATRRGGAWGGGGGIAPTHSWLRHEMGVSGQRHAPAAHAPGKGPPLPIVQEAGRTSEPVWTQRLEEKSFAPARDQTPIVRSSSPYSDTILTELLNIIPRVPKFLTSIISCYNNTHINRLKYDAIRPKIP